MTEAPSNNSALDPVERHARELAREVVNLPAHWQLWLLELLHEDLDASDAVERATTQRSETVARAIRILGQVAEHLGLDGDERLSLTMQKFDQAPATVREHLKARQAKAPFKDSWELAKGIAFGEEKLPISAKRLRERRSELSARARSVAFHMSTVRDWLASGPPTRSRPAYEAWREKHNQKLPEQAKPAPSGSSIESDWECSWAEIVIAAKNNSFPRQTPESEEPADADQAALKSLREQPVAAPAKLIDDPNLRARRLAQLREASGLPAKRLSQQAGLNPIVFHMIEAGKVADPRISTLLKVAKTLEISLDFLATDDGRAGLPASPKQGRPRKETRQSPRKPS